MSTENDKPDAEQMLEHIYDSVCSGNNTPSPQKAEMPRWQPEKESSAGEILQVLYQSGEMELSEIRESTSERFHTRLLTQLYRSYLADRRRKRSPSGSVYKITSNGEAVVESWDENDEQSQPWSSTGLYPSQYKALELVDEFDGHPKSSEIEEEYVKRTGSEGSEQSYTVAGRLKELYDGGYIDRPAEKPFRYWLTDKGKETLR